MNDQLAGQVLEALNDKVDIDYGNMPANSTNYAPSSKNLSNCITEIPQDIKLEIDSNGYLILKAGSKLYVPNGAGVFDVKTVLSDTRMNTKSTGTLILFCRADAVSAIVSGTGKTSSGKTDSLAGQTYHTWYDTTNNFIYRYSADATTPTYKLTLPLAIVTMTTGGICTSIGQIFNGFGYIGSTIFALPGVKALVPDGRNEDGTLKNIESRITSVQSLTNPDKNYNKIVAIGYDGSIHQQNEWIVSKTRPIFREEWNQSWYNPDTNKVFFYRSETNSRFRPLAFAGSFSVGDDTGITGFTPNTAFRTVDYNDTDFIAHQAMPSNNYIDLTLGGNWTKYEAPADGYFFLQKDSANALETIRMIKDGYIGVLATAPTSGFGTFAYMPVSKGEEIQVAYTVTGATKFFRFIYANGSK